MWWHRPAASSSLSRSLLGALDTIRRTWSAIAPPGGVVRPVDRPQKGNPDGWQARGDRLTFPPCRVLNACQTAE